MFRFLDMNILSQRNGFDWVNNGSAGKIVYINEINNNNNNNNNKDLI